MKQELEQVKTDYEFELNDKKSEMEELKEKLSYSDV